MAATALAPVRELSQQQRHRVIIAAAVAAVLGERARVRRITETRGPSHSAWVRQGRAEIHASHSGTGMEIRLMPVGRPGR
jgi:hypothetical protein